MERKKYLYEWLMKAWKWLLVNIDKQPGDDEAVQSYAALWNEARNEKDPFPRNIVHTMGAAMDWPSSRKKIIQLDSVRDTLIRIEKEVKAEELKGLSEEELEALRVKAAVVYVEAGNLLEKIKEALKF